METETKMAVGAIALGVFTICLGIGSCLNPKDTAFLGGTESGNAVLPLMFIDSTRPLGDRVVVFGEEDWGELFCDWNNPQTHSRWDDLELNETVSAELEKEALRLMKEEGCY